MNIVICDDNADDRKALHRFIRRYCKKNCYMANIKAFDSGEALLASFRPGVYDIVFMDIYMNGISGIETAKKIRETDPFCSIVFITVSEAHAMESYKVQAIYYVVKPLTEENMEAAFFMCRNDFVKKSRFIEVTSNREKLKIFLKDIIYMESFEKSTLIHMKDKTIKTYTTLDDLTKNLTGSPFLRCHRSFIVNLNYVDDIDEKDFILKNGGKVPIRKNGVSEAKLAMADFIVKEDFVGAEG